MNKGMHINFVWRYLSESYRPLRYGNTQYSKLINVTAHHTTITCYCAHLLMGFNYQRLCHNLVKSVSMLIIMKSIRFGFSWRTAVHGSTVSSIVFHWCYYKAFHVITIYTIITSFIIIYILEFNIDLSVMLVYPCDTNAVGT